MKVSNLTKTEVAIIRKYCILSTMLQMIKNNREKIKLSELSLKGLLYATTDAVSKLIQSDFRIVNNKLRESKINIISVSETQFGFISYKVSIRGIEDDFHLPRDVIKSEIGDNFRGYINRIFDIYERH